MIKDVINYLNAKIDALGYFNNILCLAEKIEREGRVYPAIYNGMNEYNEINLDQEGSICYWRKNGDVSISTQENSTMACPIQYQTSVPLKLVCFIPKDNYTNDQYFADNLCSEIIGYLTTNNAALKIVLKAKKATVIANKYVTDARSVGNEEYDNINFEARYTHAYFSIDYDLVFITNDQCYIDICNNLPVDFGYVTITDGEDIIKIKCGNTYTCNSDAMTYESGIIAHAGGGQLLATPVTKTLNRVDTVASNGDSILLLNATAGTRQEVINNDSNEDLNLYPQSGEQFDDEAINAPKIIVAGNRINLFCFEDTKWSII